MNELAKQILDTVQVGALASATGDGTPLVTPLHFARHGDTIVWLSDKSAQHSQNIDRSDKVQFVVWDTEKRAVYLDTTAECIDQSIEAEVRASYANKLGDFMPKFANPQFYQAKIGQIDENSTTGNWLHFVA